MESWEEIGRKLDAEFTRVRKLIETEIKPQTTRKTAEALRTYPGRPVANLGSAQRSFGDMRRTTIDGLAANESAARSRRALEQSRRQIGRQPQERKMTLRPW